MIGYDLRCVYPIHVDVSEKGDLHRPLTFEQSRESVIPALVDARHFQIGKSRDQIRWVEILVGKEIEVHRLTVPQMKGHGCPAYRTKSFGVVFHSSHNKRCAAATPIIVE